LEHFPCGILSNYQSYICDGHHSHLHPHFNHKKNQKEWQKQPLVRIFVPDFQRITANYRHANFFYAFHSFEMLDDCGEHNLFARFPNCAVFFR